MIENNLVPFYMILFIATNILVSCGNPEDNAVPFNQEHFEQIISNYNNNYSKFLIIPGSGCPGCISNAEQLVINHNKENRKEVFFIFTNIESVKLLKLNLGKDVTARPNVFLDISDTLHFRSIYPTLVSRKQNSSIEVKELSEKVLLIN